MYEVSVCLAYSSYIQLLTQLVLTKWKTLPFLSMMSRPLVDNGNGSADAARFGKEDGIAEARDERSAPQIRPWKSIVPKESQKQNAMAIRICLLTFRYLYTIYTAEVHSDSISQPGNDCRPRCSRACPRFYRHTLKIEGYRYVAEFPRFVAGTKQRWVSSWMWRLDTNLLGLSEVLLASDDL
jgi:hypothetical protein